MKKNFLALSLWVAVAVPASADGLYVFGDAGRSNYKVNMDYWDVDLSANSFAFGAGYSVNNTFSFEADYHHLGNYPIDKQSDYTIHSSALEVSGLAKYPLSAEINIYGRLGFAKLTNDMTYYGSTSAYRAFYGIGAGYLLSEHVSLRAEYNRYEEWNKATLSNIRFGAVYSF